MSVLISDVPDPGYGSDSDRIWPFFDNIRIWPDLIYKKLSALPIPRVVFATLILFILFLQQLSTNPQTNDLFI